jgi:hypothetical protein
MTSAAHAKHQPAVDGPESELTCVGAGACIRNLVEEPREFRAGEIRIEHESRALRDLRFHPCGAQFGALRRRAPVLPDDGRRDGLAGGAIPKHRGLALVGDAHGGNVGGPCAGAQHDLRNRRELRAQDFARIVFDPARPREVLREFVLALGDDPARTVEQQ